jgi:hypothetical protein
MHACSPRLRQWKCWVLAVLATCICLPAAAQTVGRVEGVAFDSLSARPLAGALVAVRGTARSTFADAQGRFVFDSLPVGRYDLDVSASAVEQLGLGPISGAVSVENGTTRVTLALPTFETISRRLCGRADTGQGSRTIVVGVVRDARTSLPLKGAGIEVIASDVLSTTARAASLSDIRQRTWTGKADSDVDGEFALCGLPEGIPVAITASRGTLAMGTVVSTLAPRGVARHDLWLAPLEDTTLVGAVRGTVTNEDSRQPVADVQVTVAGAQPVRTDARGQFTVANVPIGTRDIEFKRVGVDPVRRSVGVRPGVVSEVDVSIRRITNLATVAIRAVSARQQRILDMERRRELQLGWFADSLELRRYPNMAAAIRATSGRKNVCAIFVDGVKQPPDSFTLEDYKLPMIAQLEVQAFFTPLEYQQKKPCPVLLLWTKLGLP